MRIITLKRGDKLVAVARVVTEDSPRREVPVGDGDQPVDPSEASGGDEASEEQQEQTDEPQEQTTDGK